MPILDDANDEALILAIEPGKPETTGGRITQKGQKGYTCDYYATNWIRNRYGKNANINNSEAREIEKRISTNRKKLSKLSEIQEFERSLIKAIQTSKKEYKAYLDKDITIRCPQLNSRQKELLDTFVKDYISDNKISLIKKFNKMDENDKFILLFKSNNLLEFFQRRQAQQFIDIFQDECLSYGVDIRTYTTVPGFQVHITKLKEDLQEKIKHGISKEIDEYIHSNYYSSLNLDYQGLLLHELAIFSQLKLYGLKYRSFDFSKGIGGIMQALRKYGPLKVTGFLGKPFYKPESENPKKIGNKNVYSFPPNSYNQEYAIGEHSIVIIGASKNGYEKTTQDLIYYIDPIDNSVPNKPVKIYIMSFNSFAERMKNQPRFNFEGGKISYAFARYVYNPSYSHQIKSELAKKFPLEPNTEPKVPTNNHYSFFNCKNVVAMGIGMAVAATAITYRAYRI